MDWSVSSLKAMGTCGHQWMLKYHGERHEEEATPPLAFGSSVHKTIERIHKEGKSEPAQWQRVWNEEWYTHSNGVDWTGFRKSQFEKLGYTMIDNYLLGETEERKDWEILQIEFPFPNKGGDRYLIGAHPIKGVIDQVRRLPDGKILIMDLKTSKELPGELMLRADPQFTVYWHVAKEKYGVEPLIGWLHLRTGELVLTQRTQHDIDEVEGMLNEAQERVNQKMFARNLGYHCRYCSFQQSCLGSLAAGN